MRIPVIAVAFAAFSLVVPAQAADDVKAPTVDMTAVLMNAAKTIKDCPVGHDYKADPNETGCPPLTLGAAADYGVGFAIETDRTLDWKQKAHLRYVVSKYRDSKEAVLTGKEADELMDRIGNVYKLLPHGDLIIFAAMKLLQPAAFSRLGE